MKDYILVAITGISLMVAGLFATGEEDHIPVVGNPAPADPTPVPFCKAGWQQHEDRALDAVSYSCTRDGWRVVLTAEKAFSHAYRENTPGAVFEYDAARVPGW